MKIWSSADLYPPQSDDTRKLLDALLVGSPVELRRALSLEERNALRARRSELYRWIAKPSIYDVTATVTPMLDVFGIKSDARRYTTLLADMPLWATKRACDQLAQAAGKAAPTADQLHATAAALVQPIYTENMRLNAALNGRANTRVERTGETVAQVAAAHAAFRDRVTGESIVERERRDQVAQSAAQLLREGTLDHIRQGYVAAGLDVPEGDTIVSIPLLLEMGWSIEQDGDGNKVLVRPAFPPPLRRSLGIR